MSSRAGAQSEESSLSSFPRSFRRLPRSTRRASMPLDLAMSATSHAAVSPRPAAKAAVRAQVPGWRDGGTAKFASLRSPIRSRRIFGISCRRPEMQACAAGACCLPSLAAGASLTPPRGATRTSMGSPSQGLCCPSPRPSAPAPGRALAGLPGHASSSSSSSASIQAPMSPSPSPAARNASRRRARATLRRRIRSASLGGASSSGWPQRLIRTRSSLSASRASAGRRGPSCGAAARSAAHCLCRGSRRAPATGRPPARSYTKPPPAARRSASSAASHRAGASPPSRPRRRPSLRTLPRRTQGAAAAAAAGPPSALRQAAAGLGSPGPAGSGSKRGRSQAAARSPAGGASAPRRGSGRPAARLSAPGMSRWGPGGSARGSPRASQACRRAPRRFAAPMRNPASSSSPARASKMSMIGNPSCPRPAGGSAALPGARGLPGAAPPPSRT
mmetsp:Transcript_3145/g.7388  ORF Transcript_3145/g.7388 Transcript_3145/m.7388 type:complete len:446 (-) Transcript_3145:150-1487(-)